MQEFDNLQAIDILLGEKETQLGCLDMWKRNPMHYACQSNNIANVERLLREHGIIPLLHAADCDGKLPEQLTTNPEIKELLINKKLSSPTSQFFLLEKMVIQPQKRKHSEEMENPIKNAKLFHIEESENDKNTEEENRIAHALLLMGAHQYNRELLAKIASPSPLV